MKLKPELNFESKKQLSFDWPVWFKALSKSGINLGHFA
jgi:hypothetical protein